MSDLKQPAAWIRMDVALPDGYRGDYRAAIDEAREVAEKLGQGVKLVYANQRAFLLVPGMTNEAIEALKNERFSIGV